MVTTQYFLRKHSFTNNFPKCVWPKNKVYATWLFSKNPIRKLLTTIVQSKFTSTEHRIQPIKLLVPSPSTLEPRNTNIKPINNKVYYKIMYQICLHKLERIASKINSKPLKPSLTSPRQVPYPTGNQTSIQDTHRTTTQPKPLISLPQKMCVYQLDSTYVTTKPW